MGGDLMGDGLHEAEAVPSIIGSKGRQTASSDHDEHSLGAFWRSFPSGSRQAATGIWSDRNASLGGGCRRGERPTSFCFFLPHRSSCPLTTAPLIEPSDRSSLHQKTNRDRRLTACPPLPTAFVPAYPPFSSGGPTFSNIQRQTHTGQAPTTTHQEAVRAL